MLHCKKAHGLVTRRSILHSSTHCTLYITPIISSAHSHHDCSHAAAWAHASRRPRRAQAFKADVILCDLINVCNHAVSQRLGDVPLVSLHTGAPLLPLYNSCAPSLTL